MTTMIDRLSGALDGRYRIERELAIRAAGAVPGASEVLAVEAGIPS